MNRIFNLQLLLFAISFLFSNVYAQTIKGEDTPISDQDKFMTLSQGTSLFQSNKDVNKQSVTNIGNTVFIRQIGADNIVVSNSMAEYSDIRITQDGDKNKIEIDESAKEIEKVISQTGSNNSVIDFSFNQNVSTKLELIQEGNNLIFEKFGSNELSKNLKFKMSGNTRTIIVRSF